MTFIRCFQNSCSCFAIKPIWRDELREAEIRQPTVSEDAASVKGKLDEARTEIAESKSFVKALKNELNLSRIGAVNAKATHARG